MVSSPARTGSRPVYLLEARSSAIACTSRMCSPQNSAICSKVSAVLSTSHEAVACGISGVGWVTGFLRRKIIGPPLAERPSGTPCRTLRPIGQDLSHSRGTPQLHRLKTSIHGHVTGQFRHAIEPAADCRIVIKAKAARLADVG